MPYGATHRGFESLPLRHRSRAARTSGVRILRDTNSPSSVLNAPTAADVATSVVDVVPLTMHAIRREMRSAAAPGLSVPQLRALVFVQRNPEVNLSALAEHLGIGVTGASGLVGRLVRQQLLARETDPAERRRIKLSVTTEGVARLDAAVTATRSAMARRFGRLSTHEAETVEHAMRILRSVLSPES
jgi:DNA-binding MarR family transcriptional regulator